VNRRQYEIEAETLLGDRITALRRLTFDRAGELPKAAAEEALVGGRRCALTTFRQLVRNDEILVTVQLAHRTVLGLGSVHTEKGLVFTRNGTVRDASREELAAPGG
jgi:hypothetical protein